MKRTCLIVCIFLLQWPIYAKSKKSKSEPPFHRHLLSVSMTNAVGYGFYDSGNGPKTFAVTSYNPSYGNNNIVAYKPAYTVSAKAKYSYGFSKSIRIESGLGYVFQGITSYQGTQKTTPPYQQDFPMLCHRYTGCFAFPVHLAFVYRHFLKFTLGPGFFIPFHQIYVIDNPNIPIRKHWVNRNYNSSVISQNSSLGFDLKIGYEIPIGKTNSIELGLVSSFINLILFHRDPGNLSIIRHRQLFTYLSAWM